MLSQSQSSPNANNCGIKNATKNDILLIIDDRERAVFPHLKTEAADINYAIKRIEIGDYAVVDTVLNKIIAVFERKTLEDLASSLKDGRYENKTKMMNLRDKTGCALFYILEGPVSPKPTAFFGGIPYVKLESAIYHMMVRDNIMLINTLNTLDTINKLIRFYKSMATLAGKPVIIDTAGKTGGLETAKSETSKTENVKGENTNGETNPTEKPADVNQTAPPANYTPQLTEQLTKRELKPDKDILREMWSVFRGITTVSADIFLTQWTIAEIIYHKIDLTKLPKGTKINKNIIRALSSIDKRTEERLLATIPGISESTAKQLLTGRTLRQILTYEIGAISIICVGKAQKKLGEAKASNIKKYMFMFYDTTSAKCVVKNVQTPALDTVKIAESREEAIGRLLKM